MQKNVKYYTFLLSYKTKKRIYFRRVEVSKQILHFGSVAVFLIGGLATLGIGVTGAVRNTVLAKSNEDLTAASTMTAAIVEPAREIEYQRPARSAEFVVNSGGPELGENAGPEDAAVLAQLRSISSAMDPEFLPTVWPHTGKINNEFGFRRNPFGGRTYEFHPGMDIDGERGEQVLAPANGTVIKAGVTGGYGNMIEVDHGNGISTRYGHLSKIEVAVGDTVTRGELIGLIGSTGRSTGPHLHFELRLFSRSINPRYFLPPEPVQITKGGN
jgi:murein DD-endopeptidase MepM/ murein hydrolase activator NlpD